MKFTREMLQEMIRQETAEAKTQDNVVKVTPDQLRSIVLEQVQQIKAESQEENLGEDLGAKNVTLESLREMILQEMMEVEKIEGLSEELKKYGMKHLPHNVSEDPYDYAVDQKGGVFVVAKGGVAKAKFIRLNPKNPDHALAIVRLKLRDSGKGNISDATYNAALDRREKVEALFRLTIVIVTGKRLRGHDLDSLD